MNERKRLLAILYAMPEAINLSEMADYLLEHGITVLPTEIDGKCTEKEVIERTAVYDELNKLGGCGALPKSWDDGWDKAIDAAIKAVKKIPNADVSDVKHGYWIKTGGYACGDYEFKCTLCGETCWEGEGYDERAHFCLNCGAKMNK